MKTNSSDAELLARSAGEPAAFAELYERHGLRVRRYVVRRVGNAAGDDLASEVFVRAFRARARFRDERADAVPWLLGIANHVIADHRRVERRRLQALTQLAGQATPLTEADEGGLAPELADALLRLPAAERDALLLVVWGELTQAEAAAALRVPAGTISSRITRARKRLGGALRPQRTPPPTELRVNGESYV